MAFPDRAVRVLIVASAMAVAVCGAAVADERTRVLVEDASFAVPEGYAVLTPSVTLKCPVVTLLALELPASGTRPRSPGDAGRIIVGNRRCLAIELPPRRREIMGPETVAMVGRNQVITFARSFDPSTPTLRAALILRNDTFVLVLGQDEGREQAIAAELAAADGG